MPGLCLITVPGLNVSSDWRVVHDRLLDEFPEVTDVLATTTRETILVVHENAAPGDAGLWLDMVSETLLHRRQRHSTPVRQHELDLGRPHRIFRRVCPPAAPGRRARR
jgi:hypothetical protein